MSWRISRRFRISKAIRRVARWLGGGGGSVSLHREVTFCRLNCWLLDLGLVTVERLGWSCEELPLQMVFFG